MPVELHSFRICSGRKFGQFGESFAVWIDTQFLFGGKPPGVGDAQTYAVPVILAAATVGRNDRYGFAQCIGFFLVKMQVVVQVGLPLVAQFRSRVFGIGNLRAQGQNVGVLHGIAVAVVQPEDLYFGRGVVERNDGGSAVGSLRGIGDGQRDGKGFRSITGRRKGMRGRDLRAVGAVPKVPLKFDRMTEGGVTLTSVELYRQLLRAVGRIGFDVDHRQRISSVADLANIARIGDDVQTAIRRVFG